MAETPNYEEILKKQKESCIFCHIGSKKVSAKIIYEDDKLIAFLDINPASIGHTIITTKEHYQIFPQIPDVVVSQMFSVSKKISNALLQALINEKVSGTNILIGNGATAGQKVPHFIMHIIPRIRDDGLFFNETLQIKEDLVYESALKLRPKFFEMLGMKYDENLFMTDFLDSNNNNNNNNNNTNNNKNNNNNNSMNNSSLNNNNNNNKKNNNNKNVDEEKINKEKLLDDITKNLLNK